MKADVSIAGDVEEAVRQCVQVFGRLDIMVNNAGISVESTNVRALKVHETSEEAWDRTMAINAKGVFLGCKYACQQMMEQDVKEEWGGDRGWIVNTASIQGLVAYQGTRMWALFLLLLLLLAEEDNKGFGGGAFRCAFFLPAAAGREGDMPYALEKSKAIIKLIYGFL